MSLHFCLTVRFLDPCFHGRGDGGGVEWPPSPMRAFQALIAAAARLGRGEPGESAAAALRWLESLETPPMIVAPDRREGLPLPYMTSVPNNAMDIVGRAWSRDPDTTAKEADPRTHRTMKEIRPVLLRGEAVHYVWPLPDGDSGHVAALSRSAQSISALGWGIDMAIGQASLLPAGDVDQLQGERWLPAPGASGDGLRVPVRNSYEDLKARYQGFITRMSSDGFVAPPAVTAYRKVEYRRATDPARRPVACFSLLKLDASGFRAFDTARKALTVTAMMRRATSDAARASAWPEEKRNAVILGHPAGENRFAYLPLPSIEARGDAEALRAGPVRRLMLTSFSGSMSGEFAWARKNLAGRDLYPEGSDEPAAMLSPIPESDAMVQRYLRPAAVWATVDAGGPARVRRSGASSAADGRRARSDAAESAAGSPA